MALRSKGTSEQISAFPADLFLYQCLRSWNRRQNDPDFLESQEKALEEFDLKNQQSAPKPATVTFSQLASPQPDSSALPGPANAKTQPQPQPQPEVRILTNPLPTSDLPSPVPPMRDTVHVHRRPEPREKSSEPSVTRRVLLYVTQCERCKRGKRDCEVDEIGGVCLGCKMRKYGCNYTGKEGVPTMEVVRPNVLEDSGEDVDEEPSGKGRKRKGPPVKERKAKKVKDEPNTKRVAPTRKAKGKGKARTDAKDSDREDEQSDDSGQEDPKFKSRWDKMGMQFFYFFIL